MSTQIQYRRGTGVQNNAFTGVLGETTVDTSIIEVVVGRI